MATTHVAGELVEIGNLAPVECVQPMGNQFRVNSNTANPHSNPTVAMDANGNFAVAWQETGAALGFFNDIQAQRYNSNGDPVGGNFRVNTEVTAIEFDPHVAIDNQGDLGITWSETYDPNYLKLLPFTSHVDYKVIAANGNVLVPQTLVPNSAGGSTIAFDSNDNFAIAWDMLTNSGNTGGPAALDVFAAEWELYERDANNNIVATANGTPIILDQQVRAPFRVNSASFAVPFNINAKATWPNTQAEAQVAIDANGDMTITYSGFGPDVSVNVNFAKTLFAQILAEPQNADIAGYFGKLPTKLFLHPYAVGYESYQAYPQYGGNGNVDGVINSLMLYVWSQLQKAGGMTANFPGTGYGAVPSDLSASQLGRIWQIADDVAGMLRGDANAVMFSQFDTAPAAIVPGATPTILYSDSIANNNRDGNDEVDYVILNRDTANGNFTMKLQNDDTTAIAGVNVTVVSNNNVLLPQKTAAAIQTAFDTQAAGVVGVNWQANAAVGTVAAQAEGPVDVRVISPQEIVARNGITAVETKIADATRTLRRGDGGGDDDYGRVLGRVPGQQRPLQHRCGQRDDDGNRRRRRGRHGLDGHSRR